MGLGFIQFYQSFAIYIADGKIFNMKGQPVVESVYIQAAMNYFLNIQHLHGYIQHIKVDPVLNFVLFINGQYWLFKLVCFIKKEI